MPILTSGTEEAVLTGRRSVRLSGLPDFNANDPAYRITRFEGLDGVPKPDAVLVANGGGPGAVAVDDWQPNEHYYTLAGRIWAGTLDRAHLRRLLLAALPARETVPLVVLGNDLDVDLQVFVRRYDAADPVIGHGQVEFSFALVAPDPFKYGLTALTATAGGFALSDWFETFDEDPADEWYETFDEDPADEWYETFDEAEEDDSSLPKVADLVSAGDAESRRMTITVSGPVTSGEWWVEDAAGTRLWAEVSLVAGQSVAFDCHTRTARLDGSPIDHLVFGDYLALEPGANAYRLIVGASGIGSFFSIDALEAYL